MAEVVVVEGWWWRYAAVGGESGSGMKCEKK